VIYVIFEAQLEVCYALFSLAAFYLDFSGHEIGLRPLPLIKVFLHLVIHYFKHPKALIIPLCLVKQFC
jgi:hypothetical protein